MKTQIFLFLSVSVFSILGFSKAKTFVLQDGSVARCQSVADVGYRAYRLKVVEVDQQQVQLQLDTLVCAAYSGKGKAVKLMPLKLSQPLMFKNQNDIMVYEIKQAAISVTNNQGTEQFIKVALDTSLSSQVISLRLPSDMTQIDLTLTALESIKLNGSHFDQGMTFGGHYRLILNH